MSYYVLGWDLEGGGWVTADLTSGQRLILVHSDQQLAVAHMIAVSREAGQRAAFVELESDKAGVKDKLESITGVGSFSGVDFAFPDDPIYFAILNQLLAV